MSNKRAPRAKLTLASDLREVIWRRLMDQLTPEQQTLVQVLDSLGLGLNQASGLLPHPQGEAGVHRELEEGVSEALDLVPEDQWPLDVYDRYPERRTNAEEQRNRRMWDAVQVLVKLPSDLQRQAADLATQIAKPVEVGA